MQLLKDGKHLPEAGVLLTVLQEMGRLAGFKTKQIKTKKPDTRSFWMLLQPRKCTLPLQLKGVLNRLLHPLWIDLLGAEKRVSPRFRGTIIHSAPLGQALSGKVTGFFFPLIFFKSVYNSAPLWALVSRNINK